MAVIEHAKYYESAMYNANHVHTDCEMIYVVNGSLKVSDGKSEYTLSGGDSALIKSRQRHSVSVGPDSDYRRYLAFINPWELRKLLVQPDLFALLTDTSESGIIVIRKAAGLEEKFQAMERIFLSGTVNIYAELGAALSALSGFVKENIRNRSPVPRSGKRLAKTVREYIESRFADNIRIAEIAEQNYVSTSYLTHVFKEETGLSPREYLSHIRCTRAYELILHTNMKFSDISDATGFCCANDMTRKIREYYGSTPTKLRYGRE